VIAATSLTVLDLLKTHTELMQSLAANSLYFREKLTSLGFSIPPGKHPIIPVMLQEAKLANNMAEGLLKNGVYVVSFSYPVVPEGQARIRIQLSASHTQEQLDAALQAFAVVGRKLKVIS